MDYIIGMDIGTTASKGVLYQENGKKIEELSIPYPLIQEQVDQAEEDPQVIFDAVQKIIFALSKRVSGKIKAISWSSQMHSLIGLGKDAQALTNSITWADNRSSKSVAQAKESGLAQDIYQQTGMPPHPMAPVYKLLWIKEENPKLFAQVQKWIELDPKKLPSLAKPEDVVGKVEAEYIQKLSLNPETKIILGASDGYLSTIGVGVLDKKYFALNVGTSGAIRAIAPKAIVDSKNRFFCYPVDNSHYLLGGPVNNGGIVFEWARKTIFGPDQTAEDFINVAETVPAGSNGLIFHPYLGGERAPIWNAQARGSFIGLSRKHTKPQMARSVLEGIVFNLLGAARGLREKLGEPEALRVTGGFVRSDFVRQLIADIFNLPVVVIKNDQSGTLAAMFLAQLGLNKENSLDKIVKEIDDSKVYFPNPKNVQVYQDIIPIYREVEHDLDQSYDKIARFQKKYPKLFE